jgi:hypothetical protein
MPNCFKCEKNIVSAVVSDKEIDIWQMPCDAVLLDGGSTFGSSIYDSMVDGIGILIIICDECLKAAKGTGRLKEINVKKRWEDWPL